MGIMLISQSDYDLTRGVMALGIMSLHYQPEVSFLARMSSNIMTSYFFPTFPDRFSVYLQDGYFETRIPRRSSWTHIVLNYLGPSNGEGIRIYENGRLAGSDVSKQTASPYQTGNGRIVVGRKYTESNQQYASIEIDVLVYFNTYLSSGKVQSIHNAA